MEVRTNDITATTTGLMIVAFVAVAFCVLGAIILFFYNEKKVMKTIAKKEDAVFLAAIESEEEALADTEAKSEAETLEAQEEVKAEERAEEVVEEAKEVENEAEKTEE